MTTPTRKASTPSAGDGGASLFWCTALAPVFLLALIQASTVMFSPIVNDPTRPHHTLIPFVGFAVSPAVYLGLTRLWRARTRLAPLRKLVVAVLIAAFTLHNLLSLLYANINNDAHSDSLMVDVIAPPEFFNKFEYIPEPFHLSENVSTWAKEDILSGPHLDINAVRTAGCRRSFVRFMFHRILKHSRISALLGSDEVMFGGAWSMNEGGSPQRIANPKVFIDFAFGNDFMFNKILIYPLWVDRHNWYGLWQNKLDDANKNWHIYSPKGVVQYNDHPVEVKAAVGKAYATSDFVMDQYSSMGQGHFLDLILGKRFCFRKMMKAQQALEISGSIVYPFLKGEVQFPSGSADDCSKPYIRGVLNMDLHWTRDTYLC